MCATIVIKILLFVITFTVWVAGIILIVFGAFGLSSPRYLIKLLSVALGTESVVDIIDVYGLLERASIFMVSLGGLIFLFGWIGCRGVPKSHKISQILFFGTLVFAVLAEVALIIYAALYPASVTGYIKHEMYRSLQGYESEKMSITGEITFSLKTTYKAWQNLQSKTHCCGAGIQINDGYMDYTTLGVNSKFNYTYNSKEYVQPRVPPTCCATVLATGNALVNAKQIADLDGCLTAAFKRGSYWEQSCWKEIEEMIYQYNYISIITCTILIAAEILAVLLTVYLWNINY